MKYKITKQYASGQEILFAECNDMNDAKMFIDQILVIDESRNLKSVYRIFDEDKFLCDINYENTNTKKIRAQYADGDCELPSSVSDPFNVIILNLKSEITLAKFSNLNDAKLFVELKILADADLNIDITYYILDGDKFIEKCNKLTLEKTNKGSKETKHLFRPSPYIYRFRPRGTAYGIYNTGEEDDDDINKKN